MKIGRNFLHRLTLAFFTFSSLIAKVHSDFQECGAVLHGEGNLQSHGYPESYPSELDCTWTIAAGPEDRVNIRFVDFALAPQNADGTCPTDYLQIFVMQYAPKFCGEGVDKLPSDGVLSVTGPVRLRLVSDGSMAFKGFSVVYQAPPEPTEAPPPEDVVSCASNPCKNGAECVDIDEGQVHCFCLDGFDGEFCENNIDECASSPCLNGGTCRDGDNEFICDCPEGFIGEDCGVDLDECRADPCINGGTCIDGANSFECQCAAGFTGWNCGQEIDECESHPCQNNGVCEDFPGYYECICYPGFSGRNCEIPPVTTAPTTARTQPPTTRPVQPEDEPPISSPPTENPRKTSPQPTNSGQPTDPGRTRTQPSKNQPTSHSPQQGRGRDPDTSLDTKGQPPTETTVPLRMRGGVWIPPVTDGTSEGQLSSPEISAIALGILALLAGVAVVAHVQLQKKKSKVQPSSTSPAAKNKSDDYESTTESQADVKGEGKIETSQDKPKDEEKQSTTTRERKKVKRQKKKALKEKSDKTMIDYDTSDSGLTSSPQVSHGFESSCYGSGEEPSKFCFPNGGLSLKPPPKERAQQENDEISCLSNTIVGSTDVVDRRNSIRKQALRDKSRLAPEKVLEPITEASNLSETQTVGYPRKAKVRNDNKDAAKRPKSTKSRRPLSSKMAAARRLMLQIAKLKQKNLEEDGEEDSDINSYTEKVSKEELRTISQLPLRNTRARFETPEEASYKRFFGANAGMDRYPGDEIVEEYSPNDDNNPKRRTLSQVAERKPLDIIEQISPPRNDEKPFPETIQSSTKQKRKSARKRRLKFRENTGKLSTNDDTPVVISPAGQFSKLATRSTGFSPSPNSIFGQDIQQSNRVFYPHFPFSSNQFHQQPLGSMASSNPPLPPFLNPLKFYNTRTFNPHSQQVDQKPSMYQSPYYFPPYNRNPILFAEPKLFEPTPPFADQSPGKNVPKKLPKSGIYSKDAGSRRISTSKSRKRPSVSPTRKRKESSITNSNENQNPSSAATTPRRTPSRRPSTSISTIEDVFDSRNPRSHEMAEFPLLTTVLAKSTLPHVHDNFTYPRTSIGTSRYMGENSPFSDNYPHHNPFLYGAQSSQNSDDQNRPKTTPFFFGLHEVPPEMSLSRERAFVKHYE